MEFLFAWRTRLSVFTKVKAEADRRELADRTKSKFENKV